MTNLLKADMFRFVKSKQFLIAAIVTAVIAIGTPLLYFGITKGVALAIGESLDPDDLTGVFAGKDYAFINYGFYYNLAGTSPNVAISGFMFNISFIISVILFSIAVARDFTYGTIRNKIITGKSRVSIYASLFITLYTFLVSLTIIGGLLSFATFCLFFKYDGTGLTIFTDYEALGNLLLSLVFILCAYFFICSFICFFAVGMGKTPLAIVFTMLLGIAGYLASSILPSIRIILESLAEANGKDYSMWYNLFNFINTINVFDEFASLNLYGYKYYQIVGYILYPLSFGCGISALGILVFNKRSLK